MRGKYTFKWEVALKPDTDGACSPFKNTFETHQEALTALGLLMRFIEGSDDICDFSVRRVVSWNDSDTDT